MNRKKIKRVIDRWDPIGLLAMGCPKDEYDLEISQIYNKSSKNIGVEELGNIIHSVFLDMFERDTFVFGIDECYKIAKKILDKSILHKLSNFNNKV